MVLFPKRNGTDSLIQSSVKIRQGIAHTQIMCIAHKNAQIDVTQVTCNTTAIRKKIMWFVTPVLSSKNTGMLYNIACGISKKIKIKIT